MKYILLFIIIPVPNYAICQPDKAKELISYVDINCIPIKYLKAENGLEDLKPLNIIIGDASIVALGECTHGSSEIFSIKHRMLEYLVKEKGFTIFSIEANMPEAYEINKFIISGEGDPKKLLAGMYFWTWNTQEVLDMITWMKNYNDTSVKKIMLTGFDMQIPTFAIKVVRNFIKIYQPSLLSVINNYDTLYLQNRLRKDNRKSIAKQLQGYVQNIMDSLNILHKNKRDTAFGWAFQNAKILWQYACLINGNPDRDESMAENVKWISDQNPDAKMVIWAHNEHIRKGKNKFGVIRMGDYLNKFFGDKYIAIASSTEEGTYTGLQKENRKFAVLDSGNVLAAADKNDIEYYFKQSKYENFIVDLKKPDNYSLPDLLTYKKIRIRDIGAFANDKFQFMESDLRNGYDMLIFLKRTSSSKCFSITKKE